MARCINKSNLEVHHIRRYGGNDINNAEVLCNDCHQNTDTYGKTGESPPRFSDNTKSQALKRSGNQCECTRIVCGTH